MSKPASAFAKKPQRLTKLGNNRRPDPQPLFLSPVILSAFLAISSQCMEDGAEKLRPAMPGYSLSASLGF